MKVMKVLRGWRRKYVRIVVPAWLWLWWYRSEWVSPGSGRQWPPSVSWSQLVSEHQTRASVCHQNLRYTTLGIISLMTKRQWGGSQSGRVRPGLCKYQGTESAVSPLSSHAWPGPGWSPTPTATPGAAPPRPRRHTPPSPRPPTRNIRTRGKHISTLQWQRIQNVVNVLCGFRFNAKSPKTKSISPFPASEYLCWHIIKVWMKWESEHFQPWQIPIYIHSKRLGNRMRAVCDWSPPRS